MTTSSAVPAHLIDYRQAGLELDDQLRMAAGRLGDAIEAFRLSMPKLGSGLPDLDRSVHAHAVERTHLADWVSKVGVAFLDADRQGAGKDGFSPGGAVALVSPVTVANAVLARSVGPSLYQPQREAARATLTRPATTPPAAATKGQRGPCSIGGLRQGLANVFGGLLEAANSVLTFGLTDPRWMPGDAETRYCHTAMATRVARAAGEAADFAFGGRVRRTTGKGAAKLVGHGVHQVKKAIGTAGKALR